MEQLDINKIRSLYENVNDVWPTNDLWHQYSKKEIEKYINKQSFSSDAYILNAGSGGNTYGISNKMHHVDIAENKIDRYPEYSVSSVESLSLPSNIFTDVLCVGSVINYCDALAAIAELSRVIKQKGKLILEFESSWGFEHIRSKGFMKSATLVDLSYFGGLHKQWIYSPKYIEKILKQFNFIITHVYRFHYISGLHYSKYQDENAAYAYTRFDGICRFIPQVKLHSNNVIFTCQKS
ncbi:MAG: methyltransferase domain-containing protein [Chitinispirillales bacterium]|jgi:SAM-dependent methyltransferase|nr:methyltransferase domain-containing protein [Chitinispirillales bacterium]